MTSTRLIAPATGLILLIVLAGPDALEAGQKGRGPQKSAAPKPSAPKGPSVKANKPVTSVSKAPSAGHAANAGKSANAGKAKGGPTSTAVSGRSTITSGVVVPTNAVAAKVLSKPKLVERFATRFPGMDINLATEGFKNFGQFVAAFNVSNNLDIPFADLKAAMTGTTIEGVDTGKSTLSLGQAIQELRPDADATAEARVATTQAVQFESGAVEATTAVKRPKRGTQSASR